MSQSKLAQQPQIWDAIIQVMRANPAKSFEQIANDIRGCRCSVRATIVRRATQHSGYSSYAQQAQVLLTSQQKQKHVAFLT